MPSRIFESLITVFVVLDPIGSVPIFLNATAGLTGGERRKVALVAVLVATFVLMLSCIAASTRWKPFTSAFRRSALPARRCCSCSPCR